MKKLKKENITLVDISSIELQKLSNKQIEYMLYAINRLERLEGDEDIIIEISKNGNIVARKDCIIYIG